MSERIDLRIRTRDFAVRIVRLYCALPKGTESQVMGKQVLRSGTSVGANYREACRAKSDADFVNKLETCLQELDETDYWLELLEVCGIVTPARLGDLRKETDDLIALFVKMTKNVKSRRIKRP